MKQIRETVIRKVAKLISENPALRNYQIERVDGEHQMSGTRNLRELKKQFRKDTYNQSAYFFHRNSNTYIFTPTFMQYCRQVSETANWSRK